MTGPVLKKGYKALMEEANREVRTVTLDEAKAMLDQPGFTFVDLRDVREIEREGMVPGAFHAPRGMLEFWIDPESPYYKPVFGSGHTFVFYCWTAWRSALAAKAVQDMGLGPVCHVEGGFKAWKEAGLPVGDRETRMHP